jgi:four helix bundle protein
MAGVRRHQDLIAWQRCMELADVVFEITESGRSSKDFKFRDQIRDAAQSAAPLIAEGFVRFLPGDFVRYLRMARAEVAEVQSDLDTGRRRLLFRGATDPCVHRCPPRNVSNDPAAAVKAVRIGKESATPATCATEAK